MPCCSCCGVFFSSDSCSLGCFSCLRAVAGYYFCQSCHTVGAGRSAYSCCASSFQQALAAGWLPSPSIGRSTQLEASGSSHGGRGATATGGWW